MMMIMMMMMMMMMMMIVIIICKQFLQGPLGQTAARESRILT